MKLCLGSERYFGQPENEYNEQNPGKQQIITSVVKWQIKIGILITCDSHFIHFVTESHSLIIALL